MSEKMLVNVEWFNWTRMLLSCVRALLVFGLRTAIIAGFLIRSL